MSDEHDSTVHDSNLHDPRVRGAFERLRNDAHEVDTMAALRSTRTETRPTWIMPALAGAAAAAVLLIAGLAFIWNDGDDGNLIAGEPPGTTVENSGVTGSTDGPDSGGAPFDLEGTSWILASGTTPDGPVPIVAGWPITLEFRDDTLTGTAACNGYGANYRIDESAITIEQPGHDDAGCDGNVMESQIAFIDALPTIASFGIEGSNLVLRGPDVELVFESAIPVPTEELLDQVWLLDGLINGDTTTEPSGDPATLLFTSDGAVEGGTGCRTFSGEYIITGTAVVFPNFGMSGECTAQLAGQDSAVVSVLESGFTAVVIGDELTLTAQGNEGLHYRAIDEVPDQPDEPVTGGDVYGVDGLLEIRPTGDVTVSAHLVDNGGGWYLCPGLSPDPVPFCSGGRWVVVTNVDDDLLTQLGPTTVSDAFRTVTYTEDPISVTGTLLEDSRFALAGSDPGVELTSDDQDLLRAYTEVDASSPDPAALRISPDGATISLANVVAEQRSFDELAEAANWTLDSEAFRGRVGPFSALDLLGNSDKVTFMAGPHDHCASPPAPVPENLRDVRQLSIQPTDIDSCLAWWTIDLFVDEQGEVIGIVLDTWEP